MKKYFAVLLVLLSLSCTVTLLVKTDPEYATVYADGRNCGKSPIELTYNVTKDDQARGYVLTDTVTARWLSGATTKERIKVNCKTNEVQEYTLIRPTDFPNVDIDAKYVQEKTKKQIEVK